MNLAIICVPANGRGRQSIHKRFDAAVAYIEQYFPASGRVIKRVGDTFIYNAESLGGIWKTPCTFETERGFYSLSQPAIPVNQLVNETNYWDSVSHIIDREKFDELLPNHFGAQVDNHGNTTVWSDHWGLGRCYIAEGDIIAFSNHIGALSFFLDDRLEIDRTAVAKYAGTSFYLGDETPFKQIMRAAPASIFRISEGRMHRSVYNSYESLFERTEQLPDFDSTAHQLSLVATNISTLAVKTPVVALSGGRDSRMTSAVMLSAGLPLTLKTINTWSEETEIATELIDIYRAKKPNSEIEHQVVQPKPTRVTQSLTERLQRAFIMWDGDALPNRINGDLSFPTENHRLNISGVSGEIMRGVWWDREGVLDRFRNNEDFLEKRVASILGRASLSHYSREAVADEVARLIAIFQRTGWRNDIRSLDVLYFITKNRRWPPQSLNSHSPIILSAPNFIRSSFNLTVTDKQRVRMIPELLSRTIPEWTTVRTFKATGAKAKEAFRHGTATFQTDPEGFYEWLSRRQIWPEFFDEEKLEEFLENVKLGIQGPAEVSWLNKAIWVEYLEEHTRALNGKVSAAIAR